MWQKLGFNLHYAYQNLRRGGLWTLFAVFCIAAGVSAVVALRSLGLSIGDTLVDTVRESNNGDITLIRGGGSPFAAITGIDGLGEDDADDREQSVFSTQHVNAVQDYVDENGGQMTVYKSASGVQIAAPDSVTAGRPQFVSVFLIDPSTYLPIGAVEALEPAGAPLDELLTAGERQIVVSENWAESNQVVVGDTVRISGTEANFTITGIVATQEEAGLFDLIASFFGFAYLHESLADEIGVPPAPNRISIALPANTDIEATAAELDAIAPYNTNVRNIVSLEQNFAVFADVIGRLIVITGLGALVIGGVGIINTMLVMVRRRTMEIATLKTFGLRGGQIAGLFVWEAILLGVLGSVAGVILGTMLGGFVNQFGEAFLQQPLQWRFYPESALYGLALGMSVTVVFGVLPVLTATKVRPAIVLRPNETHVPVAGVLQQIGVLMLIVVSIGTMVGAILGGQITQRWWGDILIGFGGTLIALIIIGVFVLILWVVVWIVSRLPAFGNIDLKLALRNMTNHRWRTATTVLALMAGMYALSSITFVSQSARDVLRFSFTNQLGGNVLVFPLSTVFLNMDVAEPIINNRIDGIEGVNGRTRNDVYALEATALDGEPLELRSFSFPNEDGEQETFTDNTFGAIARRTTSEAVNSGNIIAGRDITLEDTGQPYIVVNEDIFDGVVVPEVGQTLTVEIDSRRSRSYDLEIIGVMGGGIGIPVDAYAPLGFVNDRASASFITVDVSEEALNTVLLELSTLPTVFVLDISYVDSLLQELIAQFSALPTIIGLLALLSAATIMANTVLLATLERRKQIGVLKAIGLKGRRVMGILLLENTIIALLGAGLGIGLSAMNSSFLSWAGLGTVVPIPPNAIPLALALVGAALAIAWIATFASAGVITRESVTTVLRYD